MLSLLENVMLPMDYCNLYEFEDRPKKAKELLRLVGLEKQADKLPYSVSTGQQQLTAIARALATNPPLIVADEPTGNLDSRSSASIIQLFEQLVLDGKTVVMVTHDPSLTERTTRNIIISDGELIDEIVATALPLLNHRQMLNVTKNSIRKTYAPGETIIHHDQHVDQFYMIASGEVEIVLLGKNREDVTAASLSRGQYFGEVELLRGGKSIANVRACSEGPVELITLKREDFLSILKESPVTEEAIGKIVQNRIAQNKEKDNRRFKFLGFLG
jgi:ABC-type methionine transport system ATPase subunit